MLAKNLNYKPCSHEVRAIFQRGLSQRQGKAYDHHGVWTTYIHLDDFFHEFTLEFLPPPKKCLDPKITASQTIRSFSSSFLYLFPWDEFRGCQASCCSHNEESVAAAAGVLE